MENTGLSTPKIKVCGLRNPENISQVLELQPDYIGFILYPGSKRYVGDNFILNIRIPASVTLVGVFVNAEMDTLLNWADKLSLTTLQLHGSESPEYCNTLKEKGFTVIKAFGIDMDFDFSILENYIKTTHYFLFDTKTEQHGGAGEKFNWSMLNDYKSLHPFFLSGGIGADDAPKILNTAHPSLYAVDINSKFEVIAGLKDLKLLRQFFTKFHSK